MRIHHVINTILAVLVANHVGLLVACGTDVESTPAQPCAMVLRDGSTAPCCAANLPPGTTCGIGYVCDDDRACVPGCFAPGDNCP